MNKLMVQLLAAVSMMIPDTKYTMNDDKPYRSKAKKVWDNQAKCYRINGKKVDKNGNLLGESNER